MWTGAQALPPSTSLPPGGAAGSRHSSTSWRRRRLRHRRLRRLLRPRPGEYAPWTRKARRCLRGWGGWAREL